jgi:hypothetical protein
VARAERDERAQVCRPLAEPGEFEQAWRKYVERCRCRCLSGAELRPSSCRSVQTQRLSRGCFGRSPACMRSGTYTTECRL